MKKCLVVLMMLLCGALCISGNVFADDVDVELKCPSSVSAGQPIVVTAKFTNESCESAAISTKYATSIMGNSGYSQNAPMGAALWGPYSKSGKVAIPKASCKQLCPDQYYCYTNVTPGQKQVKITVATKAPAELKGTVAAAHVMFFDSSGGVLADNVCPVTVQ